MLRLNVALVVAGFASTGLAQDAGLRLDRIGGSTWAASMESTGTPAGSVRFDNRPRLRVMGDYHLGDLRLGPLSLGALRISGGLLHGPTGQVVSPPFGSGLAVRLGPASPDLRFGTHDLRTSATWPYLGVGYAASLGSFGLQADFGLAAQNPMALSLARIGDTAGWDTLARDLRLTPVLRLGMTYRF